MRLRKNKMIDCTSEIENQSTIATYKTIGNDFNDRFKWQYFQNDLIEF